MAKQIEEFLRQDLGLSGHISNKGWYRACCPVHGETRPSFGVYTFYPYVAKCFSCGYNRSLVDLTAKILRMSRESAHRLIMDTVEIQIDFEERRKQGIQYVPTVITDMYSQSYPRSLAEKYLHWRKVAPWAARLFDAGYDDLEKALVFPMVNVDTFRVQGHIRTVFLGGFDDVMKEKVCNDAGLTVTVPHFHRRFRNCVVVEGATDALKLLPLLMRDHKNFNALPIPVVLNTAFPTADQIRFVRRFESIFLALDHDDTGQRARDFLIRKLRDRPLVFDLIYSEKYKDPGELSITDQIKPKLVLDGNGKKYY